LRGAHKPSRQRVTRKLEPTRAPEGAGGEIARSRKPSRQRVTRKLEPKGEQGGKEKRAGAGRRAKKNAVKPKAGNRIVLTTT
jgi:hypothetical protein